MDENKEREKKRTRIDDWMVRISFAEAGEAGKASAATGGESDQKTRLALDRLTIVRDEIAAREQGAGMVNRTEPGSTDPSPEKEIEHLRVMILDDEPIVGKRLAPALEKQGFQVDIFLDPREALARLKEVDFDIIVTDVRMEEIDGIQVLEEVMNTCPNTRVILITGYATVEVAREALVKGAFDFIAKPFKPKDLRAVINKAALSLGHRGVI